MKGTEEMAGFEWNAIIDTRERHNILCLGCGVMETIETGIGVWDWLREGNKVERNEV